MMRALLLLALLPLPALAAGVLVLEGELAEDRWEAVSDALDVEAVQPFAIPDTDGWPGTVGFAPCAGEPADLAAVLAAARASIQDFEAAAAAAALEGALDSAPCSERAVPRADLLAALEVLGEAAQIEGDEARARAAYQQLLAIDPAYALTSPPGTGYDALYSAVRRDVASQQQAPVGLWHEGGVWWDGAEVPARSGVPLTALPGRHLLQWATGEDVAGAWVTVADATPASLVQPEALRGLLAGGPTSAGARAALEPLLTRWAADAELELLAVLAADDAADGHVLRDGSLQPFVLAVRRPAAPVVTDAPDPDRLRVAVGGGWTTVQLDHYADLRGAVEVGLVGPLSVRVDANLALAPVSVDLEGVDATTAGLPGFGVGVAVRPPRLPVQPFGAFTVGAWFGASGTQEARDALDAALAQPGAPELDPDDRAKLDARGPVHLRLFVDGGVDLPLPDLPLLVRFTGGVGLGVPATPDAGVGIQARAGVLVGLRLGSRP